MDNNTAPIEMLFEKAENYGKTTIELMRLNAIDKSADMVSSLAAKVVVAVVAVMFIIVFNIGISLWISERMGKLYEGFFVVGAFYALVAVLLYFFRNQWIKTPVSNSVITKLMQQRLV